MDYWKSKVELARSRYPLTKTVMINPPFISLVDEMGSELPKSRETNQRIFDTFLEGLMTSYELEQTLKQETMKYRLIKEYPGSPELGYISKAKQGTEHYWMGSWYNPSDYPEYWTEVKEVDHEILSFLTLSTGFILTKHDNDLFGCGTGDYSEEDVLSGDPDRVDWGKDTSDYGYKIHSVETSDGLVLTLGDRVRNKAGQSFIISKFYYNCSGEKLLCNGEGTGDGHISVNKVIKDSVIFVSEDGVNVYEGDLVFKVSRNFQLEKSFICSDKIYFSEDCFYFRNRNNAKKFILLNSPSLSLKEVCRNLMLSCEEKDKLEKLIRSKNEK
ncbi:MAG: hypothetical protein WD512_14225 [Candidatus Paceibacterota bacterium]